MQESTPIVRSPRRGFFLCFFLALCIMTAGCDLLRSPGPQPTESPLAQPTVVPSPQPTSSPFKAAAKVYWLKSAVSKTELVATDVSVGTQNKSEAAVLETAFNRLLAGPTHTSITTTIPVGTKLLDLALKADGIHVDLSQEFTTGGGSESMKGRLGQVLYTATSLQPEAAVWISVEGKPLEILGGEGIVVDQPLTRSLFTKEYL